MEALCDLVLLSWNHWEQTGPCLESLFRSTTVPCRLLIVDNGSEPEVRERLRRVKPSGAVVDVQLLQHEKNEGFPRGMNRGITASTAPFVVLLNNDLLFTPGWLEEMVVVARQPGVGVVNPTSNNFGNVPPPGVSRDAYAGQLKARSGQYVEVGMCIGFCMLITRAVIDRLGGLTDEVERIFFEDEDYSVRAQRAGFHCVVAEASYVWHAEHQTVGKMPEREALFARNQRWCHEKWGKWVRVAWPRFATPPAGSEELRRSLERILGWARRRTHVYVYSPLPSGVSSRELFRSVGLVPHADVRWYPVPRAMARAAAVGRILSRTTKKRFDIVVAPDDGWAMRLLGWWHRAPVVLESDEQGLSEAWQVKSHSLS